MSLSMSSVSLPLFTKMLGNLSYFLDKATAHAEVKKFDVNNFVAERLAPDMLPFARQIQIACDTVKNATARISGIEAPKFEDNETTVAQLKERIAKTLAYLNSVDASALDGKEDKEVTFPTGRDTTRTLPAADYLRASVYPNFFFHVTMAYALLRQGGVDLGKKDYLVGAG